MQYPVLVTGIVPLLCLRSYCKCNNLKDPKIINKLLITQETTHLADHAVKFMAIDKATKSERVYIACFKKAIMHGIYLTSVREIKFGE